ncbi:Uncharacterized protein FKW44_011290 [Caligus rogercresseyi]|uniref:Uncharacterized protein n=1 Tax=Caligus rogercresseyi TaxID=217165 RepID=A0A7T8HHS7_CALRO|nr:Uncharacterized protein FKW44_011290 [Caligus rogercresseyi]
MSGRRPEAGDHKGAQPPIKLETARSAVFFSLYNTIGKALDIASPVQKTVKAKSVPWWTKHLATLRHKLNKLEPKRNFSSHREEYLITRNTYRAALRKEQKESWKKLCT